MLQPEGVRKVKVAFPGAIPVTIPAFVTVANAELLLDQVPPVVGDNVVVPLTHNAFEPVISTTGDSLTVTMVALDVEEHPLLVTVTVYDPAAVAT